MKNQQTAQTESMLNLAKDLTGRMSDGLKQVGTLGDERRKVFRSLFHHHGFTQVEIARCCGLDPQTVHNAIHRDERK
jgi:DNA-directed RNA polymerase specialized sigma24 family protein